MPELHLRLNDYLNFYKTWEGLSSEEDRVFKSLEYNVLVILALLPWEKVLGMRLKNICHLKNFPTSLQHK